MKTRRRSLPLWVRLSEALGGRRRSVMTQARMRYWSALLPPPVTRDSSKADLWSEIEAMQDEIDSQQSELNTARAAVAAKDYELAAMREKLAIAYLRLNVIQAALGQREAA